MRKTMGKGKLFAILMALALAIGICVCASSAWGDPDTDDPVDPTYVENTTSLDPISDFTYYKKGAESTGTTRINPGDRVVFKMVQKSTVADMDGTESQGLTSLRFIIEDPDVDGNNLFAFDESTISVIRSDTGEALAGTGSIDASGNAVFTVSSEVLDPTAADNLYSSTGVFTFTVEATTPIPPSGTSVLAQHLNDDGNAVLPFKQNISAKTEYTTDGTAIHGSTFPIASGNITVIMPELAIRVETAAQNFVDPSEQNAYKTVKRTVKIENTKKGSVAKGISIVDKLGDTNTFASLGLSIDPSTVKIYKNGSSVPDSSYIATALPNNGGISVRSETAEIAYPDADGATKDFITIEYDIMMGEKLASNPNARMTALEAATRGGVNTNVVVSADNAVDDVVASKSITLLVPVVQPSAPAITGPAPSTAPLPNTTLTTGETAHVKMVFKGTGSPTGTLINTPKITASWNSTQVDAADAFVGNFKVNGVDYTLGSAIGAGEWWDPANDIVFEYDVTAPALKTTLNDPGVTLTASLNAQNFLAPVTSSAHVNISVPSMSIRTYVDDATPSAKDVVTVTTEATASAAPATGAVIFIKDSPANDKPTTVEGGKFVDFQVTSGGAPLIEGTDYTKLSQGDVTGIWMLRAIAQGETIKITYKDNIVADSSANGKAETIIGYVGPNNQQTLNEAGITGAPTTSSNIPEAKTYSTGYTVQTPILTLAQEINKPEKEEGSDELVVNFGDKLTYKTTVAQTVSTAKGRDFQFGASIDDLTVGEGSSKSVIPAKDLGLGFIDGSIKVMRGELDISEQFDITMGADNTSFTLKPKAESDYAVQLTAGNTPIFVYYDMDTDATKGPKADQLRGAEISVTATSDISNLPDAEDESGVDLGHVAIGTVKFKIADAKLRVTKSSDVKEVRHGDRVKYVLTANNVFKDADGKLDPNSKIEGLLLSDDIDELSAGFGYAIDPDSVKVYLGTLNKAETEELANEPDTDSSTDDQGDAATEGGETTGQNGSGNTTDADKKDPKYGEDITDSGDVKITFTSDKNSGFDIAYKGSLSTSQELTVVYECVTDGISAEAYSQTMSNVLVATASNAKPAIATNFVEYLGLDVPADPDAGISGTVATAKAVGSNEPISSTGDVTIYIIIGVVVVAAIAGGVIFFVRRRNR